MTPVYKLSTSSLRSRTSYGSMLAGNTAYVEPGDFFSIATVNVGTDNPTTITFSSIPSTYTHLQIRGISRCGRTDGEDNYILRFNSDSGNNYAHHKIYGTGSTVAAAATTSTSGINVDSSISSPFIGTSNFAPLILDILDYANTNKYKTVRYMSGVESNGGNRNRIFFGSGLWQSTSAITSITLLADASQTLSQYTTLALYGIKAVA